MKSLRVVLYVAFAGLTLGLGACSQTPAPDAAGSASEKKPQEKGQIMPVKGPGGGNIE